MEEKRSATENDSDKGDRLQNSQNKRKIDSASSSSRCIRQSIENLVSSSTVSLDLSHKDLQHLTVDLYQLHNLKHLHMEGNALSLIPEDFFQYLPNLVWLDLRYNKIKELPSGIGCHNQLKTLLLERNPIKRLPAELGNLASLTALNLRHCPLEFPPPEVIQQGLSAILAFLRKFNNQNPNSSGSVPMEMIPVEKLNLSDLMKSSLDLSDGWPSEDEMIRFQKLRDELMQEERDEYMSNRMTINDSTSSLPRTRTKGSVSCKSSMLSSRGKKSMFPAVSSYDLIIQTKRAEDSRLAALKEMKEKQALIEQRRKDKEVLQKWRKRAKMMKEKNVAMHTFSHEKDMVSDNAPYATDNIHPHKFERWEGLNKQDEQVETNMDSMKTLEEIRAAKFKEVEHRIKQHMQMLKERRKKLQEPYEDMERAKLDLEIAENLEEELEEARKDLHKEYRFTAFTGESPVKSPENSSLPPPRPLNIFSKMTF